MFYHFKVHQEDNGFWSECIELEGCVTQADDIDKLNANMYKALNLYLTLDDPNTQTAASEVKITNSFGSAVDAVTDISADSKVDLSIRFDIKNVPASTSAGNISHNCKLTIVAN